MSKNREFIEGNTLSVTPMKRGKHPRMELGVIIPTDHTTIHLCNMFNMNIGECETIKYESLQELLRDGWRVD